MTIRWENIRKDLEYVFGWFTLDCLRNLRDNHHRLIRGKYTDGDGNGCMFWLLSRPLPAELQIGSKQDLTRYFTGASGMPACEREEYQPARWLVRLVDGQTCSSVRERYGEGENLDWNFMRGVLDDVIRAREAGEQEEARVLAATEARLAARRGALAS